MAVGLLVCPGPMTAHLFDEACDASLFAETPELHEPDRIHRSGVRTALAPDDDPMDVEQVAALHAQTAQQWFTTEESGGRSDETKVVDPRHELRGLDRRPDPDVWR